VCGSIGASADAAAPWEWPQDRIVRGHHERGSGVTQGADSSSSRKPPSSEPPAAATRICGACREEISAADPKCRFCGTPQGLRRLVGTGLKWAAGLLTVLSLLFGVRQVVGLAAGAIASRSTVETNLLAAEALLTAREYASAWSMLELLEGTPDESVRAARLRVARRWLLDARSIEGHITFREIVDQVGADIAAMLEEGTARERAERMTLLGYVQHLRNREEPVRADPADVYRKALEIDPDCGLAHMLLGHRILSLTRDFESGRSHLQRAVELARAGQLHDEPVRRWQLSAILQCPSKETHPEAVSACVRALNEIRREGSPLPWPSSTSDRTQPNHHWENAVWWLYRGLPTDEERAAALRGAIPRDQHIELLLWLHDQRHDGKPDPRILTWRAFFQEEAGDAQGALSTYRRIPNPPWSVAELWDQASVRLCGTPHRALSKRDPWAHRTQVLDAADPGTPEFQEALGKLDDYMRRHRRGARRSDQEALRTARAAFGNLSKRARDSGADEDFDSDLHARIGLALGELLVVTGNSPDAVRVLAGPVARLASNHPLRGDALVALAVAYAQRSSTPAAEAGDLHRAVTRLAEAVDSCHYANWARIRWYEDLEPVRSHPKYAELLARHGRTVGGSFGGVK